MNPDIFLATGTLGICLAAAVIVFVLIEGALEKRKRPYLAARWNDTTDDWADETPAARDNEPGTNLADLDECQLILSLPLYGTGDHTTTNPTGDQTP